MHLCYGSDTGDYSDLPGYSQLDEHDMNHVLRLFSSIEGIEIPQETAKRPKARMSIVAKSPAKKAASKARASAKKAAPKSKAASKVKATSKAKPVSNVKPASKKATAKKAKPAAKSKAVAKKKSKPATKRFVAKSPAVKLKKSLNSGRKITKSKKYEA
jgi:hypothetical protein